MMHKMEKNVFSGEGESISVWSMVRDTLGSGGRKNCVGSTLHCYFGLRVAFITCSKGKMWYDKSEAK